MTFEEVIYHINRSTLSDEQQEGFTNWLRERPHMQTRVRQAFDKGQSINVLRVGGLTTGRIDYILHVLP